MDHDQRFEPFYTVIRDPSIITYGDDDSKGSYVIVRLRRSHEFDGSFLVDRRGVFPEQMGRVKARFSTAKRAWRALRKRQKAFPSEFYAS